MSRAFSTARQHLTRWLGYSKDLLPAEWKAAAERYETGGAVKLEKSSPSKFCKCTSDSFLGWFLAYKQFSRHRNDGSSPIHQSHFNRADKAKILSVRVTPVGGRPRTHHIYIDGTGTLRQGDIRQYSTSTRRA
ncbi:hypothetical protein N7471_000383 [Penicillium samsonianum]|uniref:uncharacterized protein n=1 Tax=Penicillium samsonianum TaxID=1882272 RepID=UPI0025497215|nr:uncharacterized protein N7471_000383 [Penicillium samsonianum]KAJ6149184.1 hypothetical protein N7471_000383 [Penicillium samsonianum]